MNDPNAENPPINLQAFNMDPTQLRQLAQLIGIDFSDTAPTYTPIGGLAKILIYKNGATIRLYAYVPSAGAWHYVALT